LHPGIAEVQALINSGGGGRKLQVSSYEFQVEELMELEELKELEDL